MHLHSPILKYIIEVSKSQSIRLAAKKLHISSSAINRRIIELENDLGIRLFDRTTSGVTPTKAGEILIAHISQTLENADNVLSDIEKLKSADKHAMHLAGAYSIRHLYIELLDDYYAKFPDSFLSFTGVVNEVAIDMVRSKQVELAVVFVSAIPERLKVVSKISIPLEVLMNPKDPLASRESITIDRLCHYPLILPDSSWPVRTILDDIFAKGGYKPQIASSTNTPEIIISAVQHQKWLGVQSKVGLEEQLENHEISSVPLKLENGDGLFVDLILVINEEQDTSQNLSFIIDWLSARLEHYSSASH